MKHNLITLSLIMALSACNPFDSNSDNEKLISNPEAVPVEATLAGDLTAAVTTDDGDASGAATVTDPNDGEAVFQTTATATYGTFTITAAGAWTYDLDETNTDVAALASSSDTLTDDITLTSADGTTATLTITITGVDPVAAACTPTELSIAGVLATSSGDNTAEQLGSKPATNTIDDDLDSTWSGEATIVDGVATETVSLTAKLTDIASITEVGLRWDKGEQRTTSYMLESSVDNVTWTDLLPKTDSIQQSGAEATEAVAVTETVAQYVRITGYGNSAGSGWTSLNDLTISGCATTVASTATDTPAVFLGDVDGSIDSDEAMIAGTVYISDMDGSTLEADSEAGDYGTFVILDDGSWTYTLDAANADVIALAAGATLTDNFTLSATDNATQAVTITINGAEVVAAGTAYEDFEGYTAGDLISTANGDWVTNNIIDDADGTTTAEVSTAQANGGTSSLLIADLHVGSKPFAALPFAAGAADSGSVSVDFRVADGNDQKTYINVGTGKNNSDRVFEAFITGGGDLSYENSDGDVSIGSVNADTWYTLTITWAAGVYAVSLDGTELVAGVAQNTLGLQSDVSPTQLTLYVGSNDGNATSTYFDNVDSDLF